jgi:hypothetical protein
MNNTYYVTYFSEYISGGKVEKHISGPHAMKRCEEIVNNLTNLGYCFGFQIVHARKVGQSGLWSKRKKSK